MAVYATTNRKRTRQSEPIPGSKQAKNNAGGFSFVIDDWGRLRRFLILGSEAGTFYVGERDLLKQNVACVTRCLDADPKRTVDMIVEVSDKGLAYKNEAALYALAIASAHKSEEVRTVALAALPKVARIGTHLFHFSHYANSLRGWGRALRRSIADWYTSRKADDLANQAVKYQQRDGWSHADLLRLAHPATTDKAKDATFRWMVGGMEALNKRTVNRKRGDKEQAADYPARARYLPKLIKAFEEAKTADVKQLIKLIAEHNLPREAVPTQHLNNAEVWDALLTKMPATAMVRNLGKMTAVGLLQPLSSASSSVVSKLKDTTWLTKSRVHPMQFLIAARIYAQGHGEKGKLAWSPVPAIVTALENAFYASFKNAKPIGNNVLVSVDVSGSMSMGNIAGTCLTPREAAAALALVHANIEDNLHIMGFATSFVEIPVRRNMALNDVVTKMASLMMGGTDCALPFIWAAQNRSHVDSFITITDNETWAGDIHPCQALKSYRNKSGRAAHSVVVGMTATEFSIADPEDKGSLDVVGFDASAPALISDFCRGELD